MSCQIEDLVTVPKIEIETLDFSKVIFISRRSKGPTLDHTFFFSVKAETNLVRDVRRSLEQKITINCEQKVIAMRFFKDNVKLSLNCKVW